MNNAFKKVANLSIDNNKEIELSSNEVHLNLMKDLMDAFNDATKAKDKVFSSLPNPDPLIKKADQAINDYAYVKVEAKRVQKQIRELGLNSDERVDRLAAGFKNQINELEKVISVLRELNKL